MKESITKFDLESAFKALDEIDIPAAEKGIRANKPALTEIFSRKSKFETLFEEYYDISSGTELTDAKEAREAEIAKAKLARIEKIVDLDAKTPEELLTSYVGKYIIQCPQCMTLFYKNPEDVVESEDDSTVVNVEETCQHCGNESGYTLIGKVGEADSNDSTETQEDVTDEASDLEELPVDEEGADEDSAEDITDEDVDLETLDLNLEDDETVDENTDEEDKKEESIFTQSTGDPLLERLNEETDLDISDDEFEELINLPEFKKPISDRATRAMMATEVEDTKESLKESADRLDEFILTFEPTSEMKNDDLTSQLCDAVGKVGVKWHSAKKLAGKYTISILGNEENLHTAKLAIENCGFFKSWIKDSEQLVSEYEEQASTEKLEEGGLGVLGKTIGKKLKQTGQKIKDKAVAAIDKLADKAMTREEKADWILNNALEDYNNVSVNSEGKVIVDDDNKKFGTFIVLCYTNKFSNGKLITAVPNSDSKDLVIGKNGVQVKDNYKAAENIAKGWSMEQDNGPAFIYMAKDADGDGAVVLCQCYKGEIRNDKLEKYFDTVKRQLEGAALMAAGEMEENEVTSEQPTEETADNNNVQDEAATTAEPDGNTEPISVEDTDTDNIPNTDPVKEEPNTDYEEIAVSDIKVGMTINDKSFVSSSDKTDRELVGEVIEVKNLKSKNVIALTIKLAGGETKKFGFDPKAKVTVEIDELDGVEMVSNSANESLRAIMNGLEEINESALEKLISNSLVENYNDIAGFRLNSCEYLNEKFTVNGTLFYISGNTKKTSYSFAEAFTGENNRVELYGLNEQLDTTKQFMLTGYAKNKTFITESFN